MTDKELIYDAYLKAFTTAKGKKISDSQYSQKRTELTKRIDRVLLTCKYSILDMDKRKAILYGKNVYREYCGFVTANPAGKTAQIENRIHEMLEEIALFEEQEVQLYSESLGDEYELDLETVLNKSLYSKELTLIGITDVIRHAIRNKQINAIKVHQQYYITRKGTRYHKKDCPYCKNKNLIVVDIADQDEEKIKPCICIRGRSSSNKQSGPKKKNKGFMTAFLDESRRDDPWKKMNPARTEKQNIMSYVMCKGYLEDENEISEGNVIEEDVYLSPAKSDNMSLAIHETFARIMIKAALDPSIRNIIIYSDNQSACECWDNNVSLKRLAELFDSVSIEFIPRERNRYADRLGRAKEVIVVDKVEFSELMALKDRINKFTNKGNVVAFNKC